jgi:predicted nuclease of predicted toxin-antitoxin system
MASRFKLDENLPRDAMAPFRDAGHDVEGALDERLGGQADAAVFAACQREGRVLVTLDLDFADIRQYPPGKHAGVWVLRPSTQSITHLLDLIRGGLELHERESSERHLWIVERSRIRIR